MQEENTNVEAVAAEEAAPVEETAAPVEEATEGVAVVADNSVRIAELQAIENPTEEDKAELATLTS